jgi:ribonucleoside-diphosphate reductase alpha chain
MARVAEHLSDDAQHNRAFLETLLEMRFMPAGRVQAAVGSPKTVTPYNCFVAGTMHDSFVHGSTEHGSIMDIAKQAAATMRMGGGIGYDFSTLRPKGATINGVQSRTDGPLAFMPIFDAICRATSSAGNRRGAQMGVLRIDHPDALDFLRSKQPSSAVQALWEHVEDLPGDHPDRMRLVMALQDTLRLTGFNISFAITDEFMECLATGRAFQQVHNGRVYGEVDPLELWEQAMKSTWDWAEPGVLFIDRINAMNNLWYCEQIAATNPCGEQPLPPHGACLLGSFNLARYTHGGIPGYSSTTGFWFDEDQFRRDIAPVVRAMDNVVDYATYPLPQQKVEAKTKRRMGLGITGLANAAEALGFPYGSESFLAFEARVLEILRDESYRASALLAREKGAFPLFHAESYCAGKFIKTLPEDIQSLIRIHGIRNSHLTSIAPTGTISYCADNVSSSIEPVYMHEGQRRMKTENGDVIVDVLDYGLREFMHRGRTAEEVTAQEHVAVLCTAAVRVDSAVSKTCNVSPTMPWDDFKAIYQNAYEGGAKGCTTFNPGGKRMGIFIPKASRANTAPERAPEAPAPAQGSTCELDPTTGRRSCE